MKAFWPAVFDLLSTLFSYIALNTVDSSVWQISKGGAIVTTAILSRIILKRVFSIRAIFGCTLAFIGITGVQVVAVLSSGSHSAGTTTGRLIGIGLLFVSILFNSFGLIIEKKIFDKYQIHPLKMVFAQGVIGVIIMSLLTLGFQYIPCPWINKTQCVCVSSNECYLENYTKYFLDLGK
jgi:drug/metabolite transporter (DMT)-like permease